MVRVRDEDCGDCQAQEDDVAGCGAHGYDGVPAVGEIRRGELHLGNGWSFSRMKDGWVHIRVAIGAVRANAMIDPDAWTAIVRQISCDHVPALTGEIRCQECGGPVNIVHPDPQTETVFCAEQCGAGPWSVRTELT